MKEKSILNVKAMSFIAMFVALEIVLEYVDKIWPSMPNDGSLSTALIAIFLASYLMGAKHGMIVGLTVSLIQFVLGIAHYYGVVSMLLDYVLALTLCGLASLIPSIKFGKLKFPVGIVVVMFIKFVFHTVAGMVAFATPFWGSVAYNGPYNAITAIVCVALFMVIYPKLKGRINF